MSFEAPHISGPPQLPAGLAVYGLLAVVIVSGIWIAITYTDIPYIEGLPEIPGAIPITGHLLQLGEDHATTCEKWWRQYGWSVFQIRLCNTRAVVVNSFDDCSQMLVGHQSALIDRPTLYTFHGVISSTQGFTIGSSPWDESCKAKRTRAGTALSKVAMRGYCKLIPASPYILHADGDARPNVRP